MINHEQANVVVIGAGPAGSVAATLLARAGLPVTLIEQHRFPRDKVCGECLSAMGIEVLRRVGASDNVERLRPIVLHRSLIHAPNGKAIELALPAPMWGISRRQLDHALLDLARSSGAIVRQPARVEKIEQDRIDVRDLVSNVIDQIQACCVVIADGKSAATNDLAIKAHFTRVRGPRDAIELFGVSGHYGGLAPIEDGNWNASFSVPAALVRDYRGELDALFGAMVSENRTLRDRMRPARRVTEWHASPLPRSSVAAHWPAHQIPIGNAAASLEPIGGEGMGLALRSAELAANEIIAAHHDNRTIDIASLRRSYRDLWHTRSIACRAAARVVSVPWLLNLLAGAFDGRDALPRVILELVGKHAAVR